MTTSTTTDGQGKGTQGVAAAVANDLKEDLNYDYVLRKSQRGRDILIRQGYTYCVRNKSTGIYSWICSKKSSERCFAILKTEGPNGRIVQYPMQHNHPGNPEVLTLITVKNQVKTAALAGNVRPRFAVRSAIAHLDESQMNALPTIGSLRKAAERIRKVHGIKRLSQSPSSSAEKLRSASTAVPEQEPSDHLEPGSRCDMAKGQIDMPILRGDANNRSLGEDMQVLFEQMPTPLLTTEQDTILVDLLSRDETFASLWRHVGTQYGSSTIPSHMDKHALWGELARRIDPADAKINAATVSKRWRGLKHDYLSFLKQTIVQNSDPFAKKLKTSEVRLELYDKMHFLDPYYAPSPNDIPTAEPSPYLPPFPAVKQEQVDDAVGAVQVLREEDDDGLSDELSGCSRSHLGTPSAAVSSTFNGSTSPFLEQPGSSRNVPGSQSRKRPYNDAVMCPDSSTTQMLTQIKEAAIQGFQEATERQSGSEEFDVECREFANSVARSLQRMAPLDRDLAKAEVFKVMNTIQRGHHPVQQGPPNLLTETHL